MNLNLTEKIKALFSEEKQTFSDLKLKDGTIIRIEEKDLKEGLIVNILAEDGTLNPLKEGKYELEDGTAIEIDSDNKIKTIIPVAKAEEEVKQAEQAIEEKPIEESPAPETDKITALEGQISELQAALMQLAEQVKMIMEGDIKEGEVMANEVVTELKKENKNLKKEVKALAAEPAGEKIQFKKINEEIEKPINGSVSYFKDKKISSAFIAELREQNKTNK